MKKTVLISILLITILSITFVSADTCLTEDVLTGLRKALYAHYQNPSASTFTTNEVSALMIFYLNIDSDDISVTCDTNEATLILRGVNLNTNIPSCSDGTQYGKCSTMKPAFCFGGTITKRCTKCGCPSGEYCDVNLGNWGECTNGNDVICTVNSECGDSFYIGSSFCSGNLLQRYYNKYTCANGGTQSSSCSNVTQFVTIDECGVGESCVAGLDRCQITAVNQTPNLTCADTDGGNNINVSGSVTSTVNGTLTDYCSGNGLFEYFCATNSNADREYVLCNCVNGACVSEIVNETTTLGGMIPVLINSDIKLYPDIYGNIAVWIESNKIIKYNINTNVKTAIYTITQTNIDIKPLVYNDAIIWREMTNNVWSTKRYDLSTSQITSHPDTMYGDRYGNLFVKTNSSYKIKMYNYITDQTQMIGSSEIVGSGASIFRDIVVWGDGRNTNEVYPNDIYMLNLTTGVEKRITYQSQAQYYPDVYEDMVVWWDSLAGIYIQDITTGQRKFLASGQSPKIYKGKVLIRTSTPGSLLYDLNTGEIEELCGTNFLCKEPQKFDSNRIAINHVIVDSGGNYLTADVYMYEIPDSGNLKCYDGTEYGECSFSLPKQCNNGNLKLNCQACGCFGNETCNSDGSCTKPNYVTSCSDGTNLGKCSANKPIFCENSGMLTNKCNTCGCPQGSECQTDGTCLGTNSSLTCSDGTPYGYCSSTKPRRCVNGEFIADCSTCGCSGGRACLNNGQCIINSCTSDWQQQCYGPKPEFCVYYYNGNNLYGTYPKCTTCGCPSGKTCQPDGRCE